MSLDIKNMYTNIPTIETLEIIKNQLQNLQYDNNAIQQLIPLLCIALQQNYFQYNNIYYKKQMVSQWEALSLLYSPRYSYNI